MERIDVDFSNHSIGDFVIEELLQRRTTLDLYRAAQHSIRRLVLIKVISLKHTTENSHTARQTFENYLRQVVGLEHLHLQPIYAAGRLDEDYYYIASRMIAGNITDLLKADVLTVEQALPLAEQIGSALSFIHSRDVLHTSLSPQNIYVGDDGNLYINDLELAAMLQRASSLQELEGLLDDAFYSAVEQLQFRPVDVGVDIYAFGAVLYYLVTGIPPFAEADNSFAAVLARKVNNQLVPPRQRNATLPSQLERIILRALRANRDERFPDIESMMRELRQLPDAPAQLSLLERIPTVIKRLRTGR
jgi:eukaryotic-like serine/threonine-protein kinase